MGDLEQPLRRAQRSRCRRSDLLPEKTETNRRPDPRAPAWWRTTVIAGRGDADRGREGGALRRIEEEILRDHVAHCVEHAINSGDKAVQRRKIAELMDVVGRADR